jgi:hypothetical protein
LKRKKKPPTERLYRLTLTIPKWSKLAGQRAVLHLTADELLDAFKAACQLDLAMDSKAPNTARIRAEHEFRQALTRVVQAGRVRVQKGKDK